MNNVPDVCQLPAAHQELPAPYLPYELHLL